MGTHQADLPFGKYQRVVGITALLAFWTLFYIVLGLIAFAFATLNLQILLLMGTVSLLQIPIKRSQTFIHLIKKYIVPSAYFSKFEVIYEEPVPLGEKNLLSFHPHSVFAMGFLSSMNRSNDAISCMVGLASRFMLQIPIAGAILKMWGVQGVDPASLKRLMREGRTVGILPGGFEEATLTTPNEMRIFIEQRKGFIKYAAECNYTVYPVVILNQHKAFWTFDYLLRLRLLMNKLKMPAVLFFNPRSLLYFPTGMEITLVVGKGIKCEFTSASIKEEVDALHRRYISELEMVYDQHKHRNNGVPLKIY